MKTACAAALIFAVFCAPAADIVVDPGIGLSDVLERVASRRAAGYSELIRIMLCLKDWRLAHVMLRRDAVVSRWFRTDGRDSSEECLSVDGARNVSMDATMCGPCAWKEDFATNLLSCLCLMATRWNVHVGQMPMQDTRTPGDGPTWLVNRLT